MTTKHHAFNVDRIGRAHFSVYKADEGGMSFKDAKEMLESNGVTGVKKEYSPYIGQYGISVPAKFNNKTGRLLFGK